MPGCCSSSGWKSSAFAWERTWMHRHSQQPDAQRTLRTAAAATNHNPIIVCFWNHWISPVQRLLQVSNQTFGFYLHLGHFVLPNTSQIQRRCCAIQPLSSLQKEEFPLEKKQPALPVTFAYNGVGVESTVNTAIHSIGGCCCFWAVFIKGASV